MCGISGFVDFKFNSSISILEKMNNSMPHRGPDGEGLWYDNAQNCQIGLGHKRLSIIDLRTSANQPMQFEDILIVFNGEIYNFKEIKIELESLGHIFQTFSDTEVILQSYKRWGLKCVDKFIGMFAFALFDKSLQKIYLVRDRVGVKPLFYYFSDDLFLFGSELKVLMQHPDFKKELSYDSIAAFMDFGYVPTPHSIFNCAYKLVPGTIATLNLANKNLSTQVYWNVNDYYSKPILNISYSQALEDVENLLISAYNYRMVSDVPVGVFLSGGYDSTSVSAILQSQSKSPIQTFTIGTDDPSLNEAQYAKEIAKYLKTEHSELYCNENEMLEILPLLSDFYCEPYADSSAIPTILVSRLASTKVKVVLSADGGDEIFGGYNRYDYAHQMQNIQNLPNFLKKIIHFGLDFIPNIGGSLTSHRIAKIQNLLNNEYNHPMQNFISHFTNSEIRNILIKDWKKISHPIHETQNKYSDILTTLMASDFQSYLVDDIMTKVDRATMSASIEGREPLLDHRIIEYVAQLPNNFKIENGIKKRLLKDIVHKYIPKEMMDRKKMGFAIPLNKWLSSSIIPKYAHFFEKDFIENQNIFNEKGVLELKSKFIRGEHSSFLQIWHYIVFQLWWQKYI